MQTVAKLLPVAFSVRAIKPFFDYKVAFQTKDAFMSSRHANLSQAGRLVVVSPKLSVRRIADRPRPFSVFVSVFGFCVASLWEDPECRADEIDNGLDWCRHDTGNQRNL